MRVLETGPEENCEGHGAVCMVDTDRKLDVSLLLVYLISGFAYIPLSFYTVSYLCCDRMCCPDKSSIPDQLDQHIKRPPTVNTTHIWTTWIRLFYAVSKVGIMTVLESSTGLSDIHLRFTWKQASHFTHTCQSYP